MTSTFINQWVKLIFPSYYMHFIVIHNGWIA